MRKVYISSDHAGFELKKVLVEHLKTLGHEVEDLGPLSFEPQDDYPLLITPCAEAVAGSQGAALGIVIGSSGQGEAMVANKVPGIRAAVFYGEGKGIECVDVDGNPAKDGLDIVRVARMHNAANILSLGARFIDDELAKKAVETFLSTAFSTEERHQRRIAEF